MATITKSTLFFLLIVTGLASCDRKGAKQEVRDYRPAILQELDGKWRGRGHVGGDSVEYLIEVKPVLHTMFTEIHLVDAATPSTYESLVYIGYDSISKNIFAHWMDTFGGAYSVPHGTGTIDENRIAFFIPYPAGTFRDIFSYNRGKETWKLVIDSQVDSVTWDNFASFDITRR